MPFIDLAFVTVFDIFTDGRSHTRLQHGMSPQDELLRGVLGNDGTNLWLYDGEL